MRRRRLNLRRLDEDAVARYLTEHLPRCDCQEPVRRLVHENRAALVHLLVTLRACGAIAKLLFAATIKVRKRVNLDENGRWCRDEGRA